MVLKFIIFILFIFIDLVLMFDDSRNSNRVRKLEIWTCIVHNNEVNVESVDGPNWIIQKGVEGQNVCTEGNYVIRRL